MTSISSLGIQYLLTSNMTSNQSTLATLNQQLASGKFSSNLTDYVPTDAKQLVDFSSAIVQRQSYLSSIQTVQTRLSTYDTTMNDLESIATNASQLASQNGAYNANTASNIQAEAQNYLLQTADDLNQQVNGRYIYSGTRYNTKPVSTDLSVLTRTPQTTITDGVTLPSYDTQAAKTSSITFGANLPGTTVSTGYTSSTTAIQVYDASGNAHTVDYTWSKTGANSYDLTVTAPDATYTTVIPFNFDSTTNTLSSISGYTASASAPSPYTVETPTTTGSTAAVDVSMTFPGQTSAQAISLDFGTYGQTTGSTALVMSNSVSSVTTTTVNPPTTNADSYTADSVLVDAGYSVTYGISSNDPSFQNLMNGLRYMNAAVNAGKSGDTATYQSDMAQAATLLKSALTGIQTLHAGVANNQNVMTQETSTQNADITSLENQISSIQHVDAATVSTEITALQVQLEASYSTTGSFLKLSLVNYI